MAPLDANAMAAAAAAARQCIRVDKAAGGLSSHPADERADACPARDECVSRGRVATRSLSQPRSPSTNNCSEDSDSAAPQESPASASASASAAAARAEWARRRYAAHTRTHARALHRSIGRDACVSQLLPPSNGHALVRGCCTDGSPSRNRNSLCDPLAKPQPRQLTTRQLPSLRVVAGTSRQRRRIGRSTHPRRTPPCLSAIMCCMRHNSHSSSHSISGSRRKTSRCRRSAARPAKTRAPPRGVHAHRRF
eukprot:COSAG01_NODE_208_length_21996_cov_31.972097_10_plen_251_part_00